MTSAKPTKLTNYCGGGIISIINVANGVDNNRNDSQ